MVCLICCTAVGKSVTDEYDAIIALLIVSNMGSLTVSTGAKAFEAGDLIMVELYLNILALEDKGVGEDFVIS
jgi:hypothetical protein